MRDHVCFHSKSDAMNSVISAFTAGRVLHLFVLFIAAVPPARQSSSDRCIGTKRLNRRGSDTGRVQKDKAVVPLSVFCNALLVLHYYIMSLMWQKSKWKQSYSVLNNYMQKT